MGLPITMDALPPSAFLVYHVPGHCAECLMPLSRPLLGDGNAQRFSLMKRSRLGEVKCLHRNRKKSVCPFLPFEHPQCLSIVDTDIYLFIE